MSVTLSNIYEDIPSSAKEELVEILVQNDSVRIEKIVSTGQVSPEGFFYDQDESEFVILLKGKAIIGYEDGTATELNEGDFLNIPKHLKHRVDFTSNPAVWLAVFCK